MVAPPSHRDQPDYGPAAFRRQPGHVVIQAEEIDAGRGPVAQQGARCPAPSAADATRRARRVARDSGRAGRDRCLPGRRPSSAEFSSVSRSLMLSVIADADQAGCGPAAGRGAARAASPSLPASCAVSRVTDTSRGLCSTASESSMPLASARTWRVGPVTPIAPQSARGSTTGASGSSSTGASRSYRARWCPQRAPPRCRSAGPGSRRHRGCVPTAAGWARRR